MPTSLYLLNGSCGEAARHSALCSSLLFLRFNASSIIEAFFNLMICSPCIIDTVHIGIGAERMSGHTVRKGKIYISSIIPRDNYLCLVLHHLSLSLQYPWLKPLDLLSNMWPNIQCLSITALLFLASTSLADQFQDTCAGIISQLDITNGTIWFSQYIPGGTNLTNPDYDVTCTELGNPAGALVTQDICRIALAVNTSDISQVSIETWLPRNWTGRFLSTGNGGLGGCRSNLCTLNKSKASWHRSNC